MGQLVQMMYESRSIDTFKSLWSEEKDAEKWSELLHACYWERSYERVGGDFGNMENPPIDVERLLYLEELINFLEGEGIKAKNDAPRTKIPPEFIAAQAAIKGMK